MTLDEFTRELNGAPLGALRIGLLSRLVRELEVDRELVDRHVRFDDRTYTRNVVRRTSGFDLLLLCWRPGQISRIHDHAGSLNVTRVLRGELTSRVFEVVRRPSARRAFVRLGQEDKLGPGGLACVDRDEVHQLANTSSEDLVTLHVYARPLRRMRVYCPNTGETEPVRVTFELTRELAG